MFAANNGRPSSGVLRAALSASSAAGEVVERGSVTTSVGTTSNGADRAAK
jgi:hypothetical protein